MFKQLGLLVCFAVMLTGCASTNYIGEDQSVRYYDLSYDKTFAVAEQAVEVSGMTIKNIDKAGHKIEAKAAPSFWTSSLLNVIAGGDTVQVNITEIAVASTKVFVQVFASGDIMDLGRSARVVKTFYKHMDEIVNQRKSVE
ncbi:MAG: hypothetical protein ACI9Y8_001324 [Candidatus Omnitrophota bacterium]|jgi:hypothetical protein